MNRDVQSVYRLFDHTADLGMEIYGEDARTLFINAAMALFDLLVSPVGEGDSCGESEDIEVTGEDWPDLMVNWLREMLYLWAGRQRIPVELNVDIIEETRICARLVTCEFNPDRHIVEKEIKAVTYHQVETGPRDNQWWARVILDT